MVEFSQNTILKKNSCLDGHIDTFKILCAILKLYNKFTGQFCN